MKKRQFKDTDKFVSILGMGGMRFPTFENGEIDVKKAEPIIDLAYSLGVNYYDTAYFYHDGKSEEFMGKALSKYPRESYILTDKLPIWMVDTPDDVERIFNEQIERCGVDYFDFYFCHALSEDGFKKHKEFGSIDFIFKKKEEGKIKHRAFLQPHTVLLPSDSPSQNNSAESGTHPIHIRSVFYQAPQEYHGTKNRCF